MPISAYFKGNGNEVMRNMQSTYGSPKKAASVFYALANKHNAKPMALGGEVSGPPWQRPIDPRTGLPIQGPPEPQPTPQMQADVAPNGPPQALEIPPPQSAQRTMMALNSGAPPEPAPTPGPPSAILPPKPQNGPPDSQMAIGSAAPPDMKMGPATPANDAYNAKLNAMSATYDKKTPLWRSILGNVVSSAVRLPKLGDAIEHPGRADTMAQLAPLKAGADEERLTQKAQQDAAYHTENIAATKEWRLASVAQREAASKNKRILPGAPIQMPNPAEGGALWNYRQEHDPTTGVITNIPIGPFTAKPSTGQPRELGSNVITLDDARRLQEQNPDFTMPDKNGKPWDLSKVPEGMYLHRVGADPKTAYYDVVTPHQVVTTAENQQYVTDPFHKSEVATGGPHVTPIGRRNTGSVGTSQHLAVDEAGNPTTNTLTSTSTPVTGPVRGTVPPATAGGQPSVTPQQPGVPDIPARGTTGAPPSPSPAGQGPNRNLHFTPAAREAQMKIIRPVREATTQIFGDPAQPNQTTLINFADLADDPGARARTSKFLRMTLDGMKQADAGHAGAGATFGPVSVSTGGFGQWLQEQMHVPGGIAEAQGARMSRILAEMSPREKAYVDAWLAARSAAVGLRAATGGGAYQFSVAALEQDLPVIGLNANSKEQYLNKLQHIAGIAQNGVKGYSEALVDQKSPGLYKRINNLIGELEGLKGGQRQAQASQGGGNPNPSGYVVGQRYGGLTYLGGDPNRQRSWKR